MTPASKRFRGHMRFARSIASHWWFIEDVEQAALLGLHLADVTASPEMPDQEFRYFAAARIRGEVIDHLRRVAHGGRRQGKTAKKPHDPEPESVGMAVSMGLINGSTCRDPSPEEQAIARAEQRRWTAALPGKLAKLGPRSRMIVCLALLGIRQIEIARIFGVTEPWVSQAVTAFAGTAPKRKRGPDKRRKKKL